MKGIILAGGKGTRLGYCTKVVSKQMLPVYDKPMIFYPLTALLNMGISDIAVIGMPSQLPGYIDLLGDGSSLGVSINYFSQSEPKGISEAYLICEEWLNENCSCLVLGDNIIHGSDFSNFCKYLIQPYTEQALFAKILVCSVNDPRKYGVAIAEKKASALGIDIMEVVDIEEKPCNPKSNLAVPGVYVFDGMAPKLARNLRPSRRGELEITDLIKAYISRNGVLAFRMSSETAWFDAGTPDGLLDVSNYIAAHQKRTGTEIGNPYLALSSGKKD